MERWEELVAGLEFVPKPVEEGDTEVAYTFTLNGGALLGSLSLRAPRGWDKEWRDAPQLAVSGLTPARCGTPAQGQAFVMKLRGGEWSHRDRMDALFPGDNVLTVELALMAFFEQVEAQIRRRVRSPKKRAIWFG